MPRQGRCRCGQVLKFRRSPHGYKARCPGCGARVRLRPEIDFSRPRRKLPCECGTVILVGKHLPERCPSCKRLLAEIDVVHASSPAADLANEMAPLSEHSSIPAPEPEVSKRSRTFRPARSERHKPITEFDSREPPSEGLAIISESPILGLDEAGSQSPRGSGWLTSYWLWLSVCGLGIALVGIAVLLILQRASE